MGEPKVQEEGPRTAADLFPTITYDTEFRVYRQVSLPIVILCFTAPLSPYKNQLALRDVDSTSNPLGF